MLDNMSFAGVLQSVGSMFQARQQTILAGRQSAAYVDAAKLDFAALQDRINQIGRNTMDQLGVRAEQSTRELGRLNAVLSESGAVGRTHDLLRQELALDLALDTAAIQNNGREQIKQTGREIEQTGNAYKGRINQIQAPAGWSSALTHAQIFATNKDQMTVGDMWRKTSGGTK